MGGSPPWRQQAEATQPGQRRPCLGPTRPWCQSDARPRKHTLLGSPRSGGGRKGGSENVCLTPENPGSGRAGDMGKREPGRMCPRLVAAQRGGGPLQPRTQQTGLGSAPSPLQQPVALSAINCLLAWGPDQTRDRLSGGLIWFLSGPKSPRPGWACSARSAVQSSKAQQGWPLRSSKCLAVPSPWLNCALNPSSSRGATADLD